MRIRLVPVLLILSLAANLGLAIWSLRLSGGIKQVRQAPLQEVISALAVADGTLRLTNLSGEGLVPLYQELRLLDTRLEAAVAADRSMAPLRSRLQQEVLQPVGHLSQRKGPITPTELSVLLQARQALAEIAGAVRQ